MDKSILENELLIDGFLYRLEETGPERSLPIMELFSDSEGEIAKQDLYAFPFSSTRIKLSV